MSEKENLKQDLGRRGLKVETALPEDAEGIFNVQRLTWIATYPNPDIGISVEDIVGRVEGDNGEKIPKKIERWRHKIESDDKVTVFIAKDKGKVIGFSAPMIIDGQRRIGAIYVLPEAQGKGLGKKLLNKAIEWHGREEDIYLHVASYNNNAIDFYKRAGFEESGKAIIDETARQTGSPEIPEIEMVLRAAN